jgi:hypothetical protein
MEDDDFFKNIKLTRRFGSGDIQQRSFRKVGDAESIFGITPGPVLQSDQPWISALRESVRSSSVHSRGFSGLLSLQRRSLLHSAAASAQPVNAPAPAPAPTGPPYLLAIPLYDLRDEELHTVIDGFAPRLDEVTGADVRVTIVANPTELLSVYESLRSPELAACDAAGISAYRQKLLDGQSEDHIRRFGVHKLAEYLQVPTERFPCIVFIPRPFSLPAGIFAVKREWINSTEARRWFASALERFFLSHLDIPSLLPSVSTGVELAGAVAEHMSKWFDVQPMEEPPRAGRAEDPPGTVADEEAWYPPDRLAEIFNVPKEALRKRLNRHRDHDDSCWKENEGRGPRESAYLYRLRNVRHIISDLRASSERPAK